MCHYHTIINYTATLLMSLLFQLLNYHCLPLYLKVLGKRVHHALQKETSPVDTVAGHPNMKSLAPCTVQDTPCQANFSNRPSVKLRSSEVSRSWQELLPKRRSQSRLKIKRCTPRLAQSHCSSYLQPLLYSPQCPLTTRRM